MDNLKAIIRLLFATRYLLFVNQNKDDLYQCHDSFTIGAADRAEKWLSNEVKETIACHEAVEEVNKIISR